MSFIRGMLAIQDYAACQELTSNELSLLLAIFRVYNDRRWPQEAQRIGNNELLSHCTFHGSARDKVLRQTRERLQERGLITYEKGTPYGPLPLYSICWEALGLADETPAAQPMEQPATQHAPQDTTQHSAQMGGMSGGNYDNIKNINGDGNINPVVTSGSPQRGSHTVAPARARGGTYTDANGAEMPCRYDWGWLASPKARAAVAQRIIDAMTGPMDAAGLHGTLCDLMAQGMPPELAEDCARQGLGALRMMARLKTLCMLRGWTEETNQKAVLAAVIGGHDRRCQ